MVLVLKIKSDMGYKIFSELFKAYVDSVRGYGTAFWRHGDTVCIVDNYAKPILECFIEEAQRYGNFFEHFDVQGAILDKDTFIDGKQYAKDYISRLSH